MNNLANLLLLDTTANALRIGISRNNTLVFNYNQHAESHRYHSAILIPVIKKGLQQAGLSVKELTGLAVNIGPGSFTGIRTGITTIRTMAQFLELPVYVFNTFELLAASLPETSLTFSSNTNQPIRIYLDAFRARAYYATVSFENTLPRLVQEPTLINLQELDKENQFSLIEASLTPFFEGVPTQIIHESLFTPEIMLKLLYTQSEQFKKPWRQVSPLYIQTPNITLRKAKPGTFK